MEASWDDLRLLAAALDAGSLSAAARRLGVGQATMSRRIAGLEAALGHRLLERSRSGLRLTDAGSRLAPHLEAMRAAAARLEAAAEAIDDEPRGLVRLAVPPGIAVDTLAPLVPEIRARWPRLRLSIVASTALADLDGGEADLAVRLVRPTGGDLVSRRLGRAQFALMASADYVARLPPRATLADLDWIAWPEGSRMPSGRWLREVLPDVEPALIADDFLVQRAAAIAGLGVMISGRTDALRPVPVEAPPLPSVDVYLVIRRSLADVPRVRAVADLIVERGRRQLAAQGP